MDCVYIQAAKYIVTYFTDTKIDFLFHGLHYIGATFVFIQEMQTYKCVL